MPPVAGSPPFPPPGPIVPPALSETPADNRGAKAVKAQGPALAEGPPDASAASVPPGASAAPPTLDAAPPTLDAAPPTLDAAPPTLDAAPPGTSKRSARSRGRPPWRAGQTRPTESSTPEPELASTSAPASPAADDADQRAADAAALAADDVGVDTDPLNKIVSADHDGGEAVASDVPDVELSESEVAEVLSGRVIPIGAFFDNSRATAASAADDDPADAAGATFLADVSRIVGGWATDRRLGVTSASGIGIALAVCAAAWFSAGTRGDIIRGVSALWAGYLVLRAGRWLAAQADRAAERQVPLDSDASRRGTLSAELRRAGPAQWLAALGGAIAECGVYAGLAAGASAERWTGVWTLAAAVVSLVAVRNLMTACSTPPGLSEQSGGTLRRLFAAVLTMPLGGRVLLVGVVAPVWGARTALVALLDWAIVSIGYGIAGRAAAGITARTGEGGPSRHVAARSKLVRLRDDGTIARFLGALVRGHLMPLPPALLGMAAVSGLAFVGLHGLPGALLIAPAIVMLLAAPGSADPHTGRFDWLVPVLLLGGQCLYLTATGLAVKVPGPVIFALIAAIMLRYTDLAWPGRPVQLARRRNLDAESAERGSALGWEGRMLFAGLTAAMGVATFAYAALAAYLVVLICAKAVTACFAPSADGRR